ncbi:MAG: aldo/keto reductase [Anaerolineae bacterium]|jgi:voltage-dependent potassium channel beta subunit|nr:aldo/keto reductase [Anaerolineae bacterium]
MHYRRLGNTGLKVSEISLGAWLTFGGQIEDLTANQLVKAAFDGGINFFDCADAYMNGEAEKVLGEAVKEIPRNELVISSKVFFPTMQGPNGRGLSRKHISESINRSLNNLQMDYLDIYYCHRYDPDTPLEEVVRTMNDLIARGQIFYWGTSEWTAAQVAEAHGIAERLGLVGPAVEQPQYNLLHRKHVEESLMPVTTRFGMGITSFSPLAGGVLTGKYNAGIPDGSRASREEMAWMKSMITPERMEPVRAFTDYARKLELHPAQLSLAWLLRRKEVSSVITGATKLSQLESNLKAAEFVDKLNNDILEDIDTLFEGVE